MKRNGLFSYAAILAAALAAVSAVFLTACGDVPEPEPQQGEAYEESFNEDWVPETTAFRKDTAKMRSIATVYAAVPASLSRIPLYSEPDIESAAVTQLLPNDALSVLEKVNGWLHVRFGAHTGWLMTTAVSSFPTETQAEETTTTSAATEYYVILPEENSIAVIFREANPASEQLMEPAQGMLLRLLDGGEQDGWYHVACGDITGYIRADYVTDEQPPTVITTTVSQTTTTQTNTSVSAGLTAVTQTTAAPGAPAATAATAPPATAPTAAPAPAATTTRTTSARYVPYDTTLLIPESELWSELAGFSKTPYMQMHISDLECNNGNATASYYDRNRGHCDSVTAIYLTDVDKYRGSVSVIGWVDVVEMQLKPGSSERVPVTIVSRPFSLSRQFN